MMAVMEENTYIEHHKQKTVLVLAARRHFTETLRQGPVAALNSSCMGPSARMGPIAAPPAAHPASGKSGRPPGHEPVPWCLLGDY